MTAVHDDYYAILEVTPAATGTEIKAAHKRLIKLWHPDVNAAPEATARAILINRARDVLLDPGQRTAFDAVRQRAASPRRPASAAPPRPKPAPAGPRAANGTGISAEELARRWQAAPDGKLGYADSEFLVGHWYADKAGTPFLVVARHADRIEVAYRDGTVKTFVAAKLWEQWLAYLRVQGTARTEIDRRQAAQREAAAREAAQREERARVDAEAERRAAEREAAARAEAEAARAAAQREAIRLARQPRATPVAAPGEPLAWDDVCFVAGHWYRGPAGAYEVLSVRNTTIECRMPNGAEAIAPLAEAWAAWQSFAATHVVRRSSGNGSAAPIVTPEDDHGDAVRAEAHRLASADGAVAVARYLARSRWVTLIDKRAERGVLGIVPRTEHGEQVAALLAQLRDEGLPPICAAAAASPVANQHG